MDNPRRWGVEAEWAWTDDNDRHDIALGGPNRRTVRFHPKWSNGTAAVRIGSHAVNRTPHCEWRSTFDTGETSHDGASNDDGHDFPPAAKRPKPTTAALPTSRAYWEIATGERVFGTSMMFGVGTAAAATQRDGFVDLLGGEDAQSWGLSHKGNVWHNGVCRSFTEPFDENRRTTIGMLYDGTSLRYFKDGVDLGVAFTELDKVSEPLYAMVSSTAAKTQMTLTTVRRPFSSLRERCRSSVVALCENNRIASASLPTSHALRAYVASLLTLRAIETELKSSHAVTRL